MSLITIKNNFRKFAKPLRALFYVGLLVVVCNLVRREAVVARITQRPITGTYPDLTKSAQEHNKYIADGKRTDELWKQRKEADIVPLLLSYLNTKHLLQVRVVERLGKLEDARAEEALEQAYRQPRPEDEMEIFTKMRDYTLRIALARIAARDLQGRAKMGRIARASGLLYSDLPRLSRKVNSDRRAASGTEGDELIETLVDTLYQMRRQGQDIQPLVSRLHLNPSQTVKLEGASMTPQQEADHILDFLQKNRISNDTAKLCLEHYPDLGQVGKDQMIARLKKFQAEGNFPGYRPILKYIVPQSGDKRALPMLTTFEKSKEKWLVSYARQAKRELVFAREKD